jgi:integrase
MINIKHCNTSGYLLLEITYLGVRTEQATPYSDKPENHNLLNRLIEQMQTEITTGTFCLDSHLRNAFVQGVFVNSPPMKVIPTLSEFAEMWLNSKSENWTRFVLTKVGQVLQRYLIPAFGNMPMAAISESDLLQLRISISHHSAKNGVCLSAKSLNFIIKVAYQIFRDASALFDFCGPTAPANLADRKAVIDPFSFDDVNSLLRNVPVILLELFQFLLFSGMRLNEVCALQWQDVDFEQGTIRVRNVLNGDQLTPLNNQFRRRDIPISLQLEVALSRQLLKTSKSSWVFTSGKNKPISERTIEGRVWDRALLHAGLRCRHIRQCHWTAALQLFAEGTSLENVAKQLGIANVRPLIALKRVVDEGTHTLQYEIFNTPTNQQ